MVTVWSMRDFSKVATVPVFEALEGGVSSTPPAVHAAVRQERRRRALGGSLARGSERAAAVEPALGQGRRTFARPHFLPSFLSCAAAVTFLPAGTSFPGLPSSKGSGGRGGGGKAGAPPVCFATGGEKGVVRLWRADTGQCVYEQPASLAAASTSAGGILELDVLPGGAGLLAATQDCRLLFHSPAGGDLAAARQLIGNNDEVTDIRWLSLGGAGGTGGKGGKGGDQQQQHQHQQPSHLAVSTNSDQIRVFDAATMSCTATLVGHTDTVLALDALRLPDGDGATRALLASGSKDASVRVWSLPAARCIGEGGMGAGCVPQPTAAACCRSSHHGTAQSPWRGPRGVA